MNYDWDAHWNRLAESVKGREDEVERLAFILHDIFGGEAWATGELDCWCEGDDYDGMDKPIYHPSPDTNCWRLAAAIIKEL
jgi:hypothetical protein